ncbi:hypothetical protein GCM10027299_21940 [Larkinella ripae]
MELEAQAYGRARLAPAQFYDLTPWEFDRCLEGAGIAQEELFRVARWAVSVVIAPHVKKPPSPEKLLPLPGDAKREVALTIKGDDFISLFTKRYS